VILHQITLALIISLPINKEGRFVVSLLGLANLWHYPEA